MKFDYLTLLVKPFDLHIRVDQSQAGIAPLVRGRSILLPDFTIADAWPHDPVTVMDVLEHVSRALDPLGFHLKFDIDHAEGKLHLRAIRLEKRFGLTQPETAYGDMHGDGGNSWTWTAHVRPVAGPLPTIHSGTGKTFDQLNGIAADSIGTLEFGYGVAPRP